MPSNRFPVYFVSHGGGPWPWVEGMREVFAKTEREFRAMPSRLRAKPKAILAITGHWEEQGFSVSSAPMPPMEYDYAGFPEHTYRIRYDAPGSPELAGRVGALLSQAGIGSMMDGKRGFDHGVFVPMALMYPAADVPIVMLSMKANYDPAEHIQAGRALSALRDEGVLIIASGLTYHNMRGFGLVSSTPVASKFEAYLNAAIESPDPMVRNRMLIDWEGAPGARLAHPREDHLIPLMVAAGAAGEDVGRRLFMDQAMSVAMASYEFGGPAA